MSKKENMIESSERVFARDLVPGARVVDFDAVEMHRRTLAAEGQAILSHEEAVSQFGRLFSKPLKSEVKVVQTEQICNRVIAPRSEHNPLSERVRGDLLEVLSRGAAMAPSLDAAPIARNPRLDSLYMNQLTDLTRELHLSPIFDRISI
jgi:hypothetical protein